MRKILGIISSITFIIVFLGALVFAVMEQGKDLGEAILIVGFIILLTAILVVWIYITIELLSS